MPLIYKLDPRTKLISVLLLSIIVFFIGSLPAAVIMMLSFFVIRLISGVPLNGIRFFRTLSLLVVFIIIMQMLFGPGDSYIIAPLFPHSFPVLGGMGSLKQEGLVLGLVIVCRLLSLMVIFPVFTGTTSPQQLAAGLYALKFNYRAAFVITSAFNLIPFFKEEALIILDAQKLRGMNTGSVKIKTYSGIALPLVLGAMRKAGSSSVAMDSRAFGIYKKRTWLDKPQMKTRDFWVIAAGLVFCAFLILLNHTIG